MSKAVIVIDVGTTMIKASIFDKQTDVILSSYSRNTKVISKGNKSELNMNELWDDVVSILSECIKYGSQNYYKIESICVTGQGEGLWALDAEGNPFMNAILWNDNRASDTVDSIKGSDLYKEVKKEIGSYIKPGSTLTLLKWLKVNDYNAFKKIAYIFSCKDFIRYKLTGSIFWELSDASCSMMSLKEKEYAYDVFSKRYC